MIEVLLKENGENCDVYIDGKQLGVIPYQVINQLRVHNINEEYLVKGMLKSNYYTNCCVKKMDKITDQFVYKRV